MLTFAFVGLGLLATVLGAPNPDPDHQIGVYNRWGDKDDKNQPLDVLDKLYVGCFKEVKEFRDMEHYQFSSGNDMTVERCQAGCRQQGFQYAGVQTGKDCYCSNSLHRIHGPSEECTVPCTGDRGRMCGGELANSVYYVPYDTRYRGCYQDDADEPDLSVSAWDNQQEKSADACIMECALRGYKYAGVQNGGACFCGDTHGSHGPANETDCHVRCEWWGMQNCGGESQNAIYVTEIPFDLSTGVIDPEATKAYDSTGKIAGVSTRLFTFAPHLRSIVTKKLVIYSDNEVQTPYDDTACHENCYSPCGEISQVDQLSNVGDTLTLRFFHVRLSDISKYTGNTAKKVYVYAETVVIDTSLSVDFSLLVRTRQLIIDRSYASTLDILGRAPDLGIKVDDMKSNGPEPNLLHRKMAFTCARILLDTHEPKHINTAWGIIQAISRHVGEEEENQAYSAMVRSYRSLLSGLDRQDIRFVPYYTKSHISTMLGNYYDRLSTYKTNLERMEDRAILQEEFLKVAEETQKIYTDSAIAEAEREYEASQMALVRANTTYHRYREHFAYSRRQLEEKWYHFKKGLKEALIWRIVNFILNFGESVKKIVNGYRFVKDKLAESAEDVIDDPQDMIDAMEVISRTVEQSEALDAHTEEVLYQISLRDDVTGSFKILDDLELIANIDKDLIEWEKVRAIAEYVLVKVMQIPGAKEYLAGLLETLNWGIAMIKSTIEKAELMRYSLDCKFNINSKKRQQDRIQRVFDKSRNGLVEQEEIMRITHEQTYDVRADLNDALLMFCQSYFFENHYECKDSYKPSFGGDLTDLLLKINAAQHDELLVPGKAPSTASRILNIKDTDLDPDCEDVQACPLNYFRKNRVFLYTLPIDHSGLNDLDKYMVSEIILDFKGAKQTGDNKFLKMRIESSGEFQSKYRNKVHNFLTKPLAMAYEYDVTNGRITLHADVYEPYRNIVNHITPYSTWMMHIAEERSGDIDVSDVTSIRLRLEGSAVDGYNEWMIIDGDSQDGDE